MNNNRSDMVVLKDDMQINTIEDLVNLMPDVLGPIFNEENNFENLSCVLMLAREHKPGDEKVGRERIMYNMRNNKQAEMDRLKNDLLQYVNGANRMRVMHNTHVHNNHRNDRVHINLYMKADNFDALNL